MLNRESGVFTTPQAPDREIDPRNYSCPFGSQYTCNSSHICAQPGTCASQLNCPSGYTLSGSTCVGYSCPLGSQYTCSGTTPQCTGTATSITAIQNLTYTYDLKGNVKTINDAVNGILHTYSYDSLDRLSGVIGSGNSAYSESYTYDTLGNMRSKSGVGNYLPNYSTKPHTIATAGSYAFTYDANGNMLTKSGPVNPLSITWNEDNKPASINGITFTYDGNGNRVRKIGSTTTLYFGDAYEQRGSVGIYHLFANNTRIASIRTDGGTQYYHGNHLHSASAVTDQYGDLAETIEYFPFGSYRDRRDLDPGLSNVNYTFTDQEEDNEFGLYNYDAREYDPLIGRFISADSVVPEPGDLQSFNRYSYVKNNPLVYTDPSGHEWKVVYDGFGASGYEWVSRNDARNDAGKLKEGYYGQAIYFNDNGTFNANSSFNIGSSTAYVYKADGLIEKFNATTLPSDVDQYATIPSGIYEAHVGMHKGSSKKSYEALHLQTLEGSENIPLGYKNPNPKYNDGRRFADDIHIHKAGKDNFTGMTKDSIVTKGCLLVDVTKWDRLIGIFNTPEQRANKIGVTVSRTVLTPLTHEKTGALRRKHD